MDALADFHPAIRTWFERRFPEGPTDPQAHGWPAIAAGDDTLIAAPTGSGKTLAAFLVGIDRLLPRGRRAEPDRELATEVVYVSPLKALAADIRENLERPLAEIRGGRRASSGCVVPDLRVVAAHAATRPPARAPRCSAQPPHLLITTPESLYLLRHRRAQPRAPPRRAHRDRGRDPRAWRGTSAGRTSRSRWSGSRRWRSSGRSASASRPRSGRSRRSPASWSARARRAAARRRAACRIVDLGHRRAARPRDRAARTASWRRSRPTSSGPRSWTASPTHVRPHRTTLVFVNTRRLAERVAHLLAERLGEGAGRGPPRQPVEGAPASRSRRGSARATWPPWWRRPRSSSASTSGPSSWSARSARRAASRPCCSGSAARATRAGAVAKGRLYPTTRDELVECAALAPRRARRAARPRSCRRAAPLDVLAQQIVAACAADAWPEDELFELVRRAAPYAELDARATSTRVVAMLSDGIQTGRGRRAAYLHRDRVHGVLRGRRSARLAALTSGGAIPETRRLPRRRRSRRHHGRHRQRGLGDREHAGRRVPPRQHVVADPPRRGRGRCAWSTRRARRRPSRSGSARRRRAPPRPRPPCRRSARRWTSGSRRADIAAVAAWLAAEAGSTRRGRDRGRALPRGRARGPRRPPDPAPRRLRALLRRGGRDAARRPRALRRPDQPRARPRAPQALLPARSTSSSRPPPATTRSCSRSVPGRASRSRTCRSS